MFEMPAISQRLSKGFVTPEKYAGQVANHLKELGFKKSIMVGHSFGTFCVRWMDLFHPELVHSRVFIDPVCFSLFTHHMVYNALYKQPRKFHEGIKY